MEIVIDKMDINYTKEGTGPSVILLHGWGQNTEMMSPIGDALADNHFQVYNIDLPGFGQSDEPPRAYNLDDYAKFLGEFIKKKKIKNPILIGHSFGCRIAIKYTSSYPNTVEKLVLTGAAGIRPKRGLIYYTRVYIYKVIKSLRNVPFVKHYVEEAIDKAGSEDYKNSSAMMREVLKNTVNEDLTSSLKKIEVPTLLIFGSKDDATPLWMANIMKDEIKDSKLIVYKGLSHYAYLENIKVFNEDVLAFIKDGDK